MKDNYKMHTPEDPSTLHSEPPIHGKLHQWGGEPPPENIIFKCMKVAELAQERSVAQMPGTHAGHRHGWDRTEVL